MSPEQKRGEDATATSDVYAVGLMMYRLLTGKQLGPRPPSHYVHGLSKQWDELILKSLEESSEDRFPDAGRMLSELRESDRPAPAAAEPPAPVPRPPPEPIPPLHPEQPEPSRISNDQTRHKGRSLPWIITSAAALFAIIIAVALSIPSTTPGINGPVTGRDWTSPATGMEFVWIPQMNLWVGKYEVTNGEYRRKEPGHDSRSYSNHSMNHDRQPVVYVTFDDAQSYAAWLTEQDRKAGRLPQGYRYRLPTGNEWMTFAQVGDGREYPWGNQWPPPSGRAGTYHGQEGAGSWDKISGYNDGFPVTAEVDKVWRNPWGLHGVGGNVWEATTKSPGGAFDAWRGGSWNFYSQFYLRCSIRRGVNLASARSSLYGFRLLLSR